jgi:stage II sporulation protein D
METYLMSVILSEVPISFNIEAIKAQTIVARTYAQLFVNKYSKLRDFDVDNTTNYQAYNGFNINLGYKYIKKLEKAIKETNGLIIVYEDKPIIAYFHANSGGKVRSGKDYFGNHSDKPYLISHEDPYSINYPGSKWEYKMNIDYFKKTFDLTSDPFFNNFKYDNDGFVEEFKINKKSFFPKEIRRTIGYKKIKSERFKVFFNQDGKSILFSGIGYGHGVGLSQWGAHGMAEEGYNCMEIINFYYPNTKIKNIIK